VRATRRSVLATGAAFAALAGCTSEAARVGEGVDQTLDALASEMLADSPERATVLAVEPARAGGPFAARLDDRSPAADLARRTAVLRRSARLLDVDAGALVGEQRHSFEAARTLLASGREGAAFDFGTFRPLDGFSPWIINPLDAAHVAVPAFLADWHVIASRQDAQDWLDRFAAMADALDAETARAQADWSRAIVAPASVMDASLASVGALAAQPAALLPPVRTLAQRLAAGAAIPEAERAGFLQRAVVIAEDRVLPALARQAGALREARARAPAEDGVWRLEQGAAYYQASLRQYTTTADTPETLHQRGLDHVRQIHALMDQLLRARGAITGSVAERMTGLAGAPGAAFAADPAGQALLQQALEAHLQAVAGVLPEWIGILPEEALKPGLGLAVREPGAPAPLWSPGRHLAASLDGARAARTQFDAGDPGGWASWSAATALHREAVPGRHTQRTLARAAEGLPLFRRMLDFVAYGEGWAVYAQQLADEMGLFDDDGTARLGYLVSLARTAALMVVDTGLHAFRWSRQQALDYLVGVTGARPAALVRDVDRCIVWPGRAAAAKVGHDALVSMRERARTRLGPRFDIRVFHNLVLGSGSLPLEILDRKISEWRRDG